MITEQATSVLQDHPNAKISLRWVPGHEGVEGNEAADIAAKEARSVTTLKETYRQLLVEQHIAAFRRTERYRRLKSIDETMPSRHFWKMSRDLERRRASILIQLRTGHAPLNAHLHRIQRSETPTCPNCAARNETVIHLLLHCQAYRVARGDMRKALPYYLFNLRGILNNGRCLPALWTYLDKTGRLAQQHGSLATGTGPAFKEKAKKRRKQRRTTH